MKWIRYIALIFRFWKRQLQKIYWPFTAKKLSVYDVANLFLKGLTEGAITLRAGSVSFSLFMSIFPALIFFFTLIPYVPIEGFQLRIFEILQNILPSSAYLATQETITDILNNKRGDLLSVTFFSTLIFATNGVLSLISSFSFSYHKMDFKNFFQQYLSAFFLTLVLSFLVIFSLVLVSMGEHFLNFLVDSGYLPLQNVLFIKIIRIIALLLTIQVAISLIYNYGALKKSSWHFISSGSILATLLIVISSILFGVYVDNFSQYNKLYGSIGTVLVIMLWIYINAIGIIIGFELNMSVLNAKNITAKSK